MTESNNVRFVQDDGKWVWKCYDANGSVVHRSQLFETEKEAREDYEVNGGQYKPEASAQANNASVSTEQPAPATEEADSAGNAAPEGEVNAGTAAPADSEAGLVQ
jgi:IMP dehydrogenase/GMP reductase